MMNARMNVARRLPIALMAIGALCVVSQAASAAQRMVLVEEFTATW